MKLIQKQDNHRGMMVPNQAILNFGWILNGEQRTGWFFQIWLPFIAHETIEPPFYNEKITGLWHVLWRFGWFFKGRNRKREIDSRLILLEYLPFFREPRS